MSHKRFHISADGVVRRCFARSPETCRLSRAGTPHFDSVKEAEEWLADHIDDDGGRRGKNYTSRKARIRGDQRMSLDARQVEQWKSDNGVADTASRISTLAKDSLRTRGAPLQVTTDDGRTLFVKDAFCTTVTVKGHREDKLVYEVDYQRNADHLHQGMQTCFNRDALGKQVTVMDTNDIRSAQAAYTTDDGRAGIVIKSDGEVGGLYKENTLGRPYGVTHTLLDTAIRERGDAITHLECFDTYLPHAYEKSGMVPVASIPFVREYAPQSWDYEEMKKYHNGEPPVMFMVHKSKVGTVTPEVKQFDNYDDARAWAVHFSQGS